MRSRVSGLVAAAMIAACVCAPGAVQETAAEQPEAWNLTVLVLENAPPRRDVPRMWLGITNAGSEPKSICVRRVWYSTYSESATGRGGTVGPVSVHSCGAEFGWHLVPKDGTYYLGVSLALDSFWRSGGELKLEVDLSAADVHTNGGAGDVSVTWRGTLVDAAKAGARLSSR